MKTIRNKQPKKEKIKKEKKRLNMITLERKYNSWATLFLYEEKYMEKKLIDQCDTLRSKIVRHRTTCGQAVKCTSYMSTPWCKKSITFKTCHAAHCIDRGWWSHRWDLRNGFWTCPSCNDPKYNAMDHKMMLMQQIDKEYGVWTFETMRNERNKNKPDIGELLVIRAYLQAIYQTLPEDRRDN